MRKLLISLFFIPVCTALKSQSSIDVLHYTYHIELTDNNDTIRGQATLLTRFVHSTENLLLDLTAPGKEGKGMSASAFLPNGKALLTKQSGEELDIRLPKEYRVGDTLTVVIRYKGVPADGLIISKNKYGNRTFFADNWPNRGHNWIPCHDDPADKATVEFIVTAPQHYQVVANGIQLEETNLSTTQKRTHWKEDVPISTKVMVIGVADFAVHLTGFVNDCIPVYSWVYPEDRNKGFYDYALAADILPWFINNIGPYAYKKLANVESKTRFGGLENANTIFYSEQSIDGARGSETLLAHEIAHQWFGNMATEKTFAHLWLSEGFATYMTILYMENKYGTDTAIAMLQEDRLQVIEYSKRTDKPVVNPTSNYMQLLNPNSYQKGGWILHMLRRELGDSVFRKTIRQYYSTYAGKTADTDDFRKVVEAVSGKNWERFFQQWLFTPGVLEIAINWSYDHTTKKITVTASQKKTNFQFPLEIGLEDATGKISTVKMTINSTEQTITIPVKGKPVSVIADPHMSLLHSATVMEVK
jgi:aminopeptidase N